jgi:hypothetical protein
LLSNAWTFYKYQLPVYQPATGIVKAQTTGLIQSTIAASPVTVGSDVWTLDLPYGVTASSTSYRACVLTNNQPTTKMRAFQGEGAPFINTLLFMENWNPGTSQTMNYTGSLVVMDTCRYTRDALLADPRIFGRTPFGIAGWHSKSAWSSLTGNTVTTPDWVISGSTPITAAFDANAYPYGCPPVYRPPARNFSFNNDLLSEEGTPPYTPFGTTAAGVAGWTRVVE